MKWAKAVVLAVAIFGAFGAGLGALVSILMPMVGFLGLWSTVYILGMWTVLIGILAYLMNKSP